MTDTADRSAPGAPGAPGAAGVAGAATAATDLPMPGCERIASLDVLRGFALLGILIMNMQSFAMPDAAYFNPTAWGDLTGLNLVAWAAAHIMADQKFMALFSLLFGAGVVLFSERIEARGQRPARLHYRRTFWLFVIGMAHAYLLWSGDILVTYALCSAVVFLARGWRPRTLLVVGIALLAVGSLLSLMSGLSLPWWPAEDLAAMREQWNPSAAALSADLNAYRGGWVEQMASRAASAYDLQTTAFIFVLGWRAAGLMLIGMALYKLQVLTGQRSVAFYRRLALVGAALGLPLISLGIVRNFAAGWSLEYSMFLGSQFNYWGSLAIAMAWLGLVVGLTRTPHLPALQHRLAAVGRMALSNYLLQTVLATLLFYGRGMALYGRVDRVGQWGVVMAIWVLQLWLSPIWLRHFRYGPAEWVWRSLTYARRQTLRRSA